MKISIFIYCNWNLLIFMIDKSIIYMCFFSLFRLVAWIGEAVRWRGENRRSKLHGRLGALQRAADYFLPVLDYVSKGERRRWFINHLIRYYKIWGHKFNYSIIRDILVIKLDEIITIILLKLYPYNCYYIMIGSMMSEMMMTK